LGSGRRVDLAAGARQAYNETMEGGENRSEEPAEVGATAHEGGMIPSPRGPDNPGNAFFGGLRGVLSGATRRRPLGSTKRAGPRIREEA